MTKKGFSLVELVIALGIVIIMTGAAALYLGDIFFKSQVAKSLSDMETLANALLLHDTENGASRFETGMPGQVSELAIYQDKDQLTNLLGNYLAVLPNDPWGNTYQVNAYAGWIRTYNSDYKINGTSKYEKDITTYYLPEDLVVAKVRVEDNDLSLAVDTGDTIYIYFTKSVRCNVRDAISVVNEGHPAAYLQRSAAGGGIASAVANLFEISDFDGIQPDGTVTPGTAGVGGSDVDYRFIRPTDSPFTVSDFSRRLVVADTDAADGIGAFGEYKTIWKIGNDVHINNASANAYCIWESTQGYLNYKTTGERARIYLKNQAVDTAKRPVLFKTLVD